MIKECITSLIEGHSLTTEEAASIMEEIMNGEATPAQFGALFVALRLKGETADEIAGFAKTMRAKAVRVSIEDPVVDTCGTGGDGRGTFNISTTAAFVAAGAGIKIAKHGNRAFSSKCGSADVLEALGIRIDLNAEQVQKCLINTGIGFMFAPSFHPAMKYAAAPRREIGIRTVLNILGPLTNPAGAKYQVLGVPEDILAQKMVKVLGTLDCHHALVVHGVDGLDEITITDKTHVFELNKGQIIDYFICPEDFNLSRATHDDIKGGTIEENAKFVHEILGGVPGPRRDIVIMNAAAAILASNKVPHFSEGIRLAADSIDSGEALAKLNNLVELSKTFS
jgi:anthranilate phosphoribosyltransferase